MPYRQSVITLLAVTCGCAAMLPAQRDPAREAEQKEHATCPLGAALDYPAELFDAGSVVGVKPLYSMVGAARTPEWTDTSVHSESGALRAEVRAPNVDTAKEILRRAMAFAGKQSQ